MLESKLYPILKSKRRGLTHKPYIHARIPRITFVGPIPSNNYDYHYYYYYYYYYYDDDVDDDDDWQ